MERRPRRKVIPSPCNGRCKYYLGLCHTCGRTMEEIRRWATYTPEERAAIMERLAKNKEQKNDIKDC